MINHRGYLGHEDLFCIVLLYSSFVKCVSLKFHRRMNSSGIPIELFQTLKGDAVKVLRSICQQFWKTQQWLQENVFIPIPKKGNARELSNYCTFALISHTSKVMLKLLQARLQKYGNLQLLKKRQRNQNSNCQHLLDHRRSKRVPEKTFTSALLTIPKPLTPWIKTNCGKFWKRQEYQNTLPASWKICMQVKKQQLELDMEQQTGSI